jgi:hypothetical protein
VAIGRAEVAIRCAQAAIGPAQAMRWLAKVAIGRAQVMIWPAQVRIRLAQMAIGGPASGRAEEVRTLGDRLRSRPDPQPGAEKWPRRLVGLYGPRYYFREGCRGMDP